MTADRTDATWVCMRAWATRMWDRLQQALCFPDALGSKGGLSFSGTGLKGAAACVRRLPPVFVGGGAWGCVHGLPVQPETPTAYLPTSRGLASCKKSRREGRSTGLGGFGEARPGCRAFLEAASFYMMCSLETRGYGT